MLRQRELSYPDLVFPGGRVSASYFFPCFQVDGLVRFYLIELAGGRWTYTLDRPTHVEPRRVVFGAPPDFTRHIGELNTAHFVDLFHYDPWWRLRHTREKLDDKLVQAILATNLSDRTHEGVPIKGVDYRKDLSLAEGVLLDNGMFIRKWLRGAEMSAALAALSAAVWGKWSKAGAGASKPIEAIQEPQKKETGEVIVLDDHRGKKKHKH